MTLTGIVQGNAIVLTSGGPLPNGAKIRIEAVVDTECTDSTQPSEPEISQQPQTDELSQQLLAMAGTVDGLPPDASTQLDHYLYGTPRQ